MTRGIKFITFRGERDVAVEYRYTEDPDSNGAELEWWFVDQAFNLLVTDAEEDEISARLVDIAAQAEIEDMDLEH